MNAASTEPAQYGRDDSQDEQAEAYRRALASTEPAQYGRDDFIIDPGHGLEIVASTEPAQYGRDDRERCGGAARGRPRLNGARPVRAGRRRAVAAERGPGRASTEPAQYGRDDHEGQLMILSGLNASTEPAQYGRDDAVGGHSGLGDEVAASTEPAQYGRDDLGGSIVIEASRAASTEPAQYGRDDEDVALERIYITGPQRSPPSTGGTTWPRRRPPSRCRRLNGARPVRAGRPARSTAAPTGRRIASTEPAQYGRDDDAVEAPEVKPEDSPQRSPPSTGGTTCSNIALPTTAELPQRSPPSTGGTTRHGGRDGYRKRGASTEPAQYGRDDPSESR